MEVYDFIDEIDVTNEVTVAPPNYHKIIRNDEYLTAISNASFKNIQWVIPKIREMQEKCARGLTEKDIERLSTLMKHTFPFRHYGVLSNDLSVENTFRNYPGLKFWKLLQLEFELVTRESFVGFEFRLNQMIENYYSKRISSNAVISNSGWREKAIDRIKQLHKNTRDISEGVWAQKKAAKLVVYLSDHFSGQWINNLVKIEDGTGDRDVRRLHPTIIIKDDILDLGCATVFAERQRVLQGLDFCEAVLACYFLHYIFNLKYASSDKLFFRKLDGILKTT